MVPQDLILRCYGLRTKKNTWVAKCIDFDLVVEEQSREMSKRVLLDEMESYIQAVYDTEDKASIPALLSRKAPISDILSYHLIKFHCKIKCPPNRESFDSSIPIHLVA
ncbi:MAG: hypothetical protein V3U56_05415 [Syntrophobacteria bacterium]